jgi:hypothetical protein
METMKPYRVKRGGKYIGAFLVVHEGQRVNLKTKDAEEARRRAILVRKGQWPPSSGAAAAVKEALEGKEPLMPEVLDPPPVEAPVPKPTAEPPEVVATPEAAAAPTPAAAAVNAAAATADDELERQAQAALVEAGVDLGEIREKAPELLAGAHLWLQGQLCRTGIRVVHGKWPKMVTLDKGDELRGLIGKLWLKKLQSMELDLEKLGPGWWLLLLSAATGIAQVGGMLESMADEKPSETVPAV